MEDKINHSKCWQLNSLFSDVSSKWNCSSLTTIIDASQKETSSQTLHYSRQNIQCHICTICQTMYAMLAGFKKHTKTKRHMRYSSLMKKPFAVVQNVLNDKLCFNIFNEVDDTRIPIIVTRKSAADNDCRGSLSVVEHGLIGISVEKEANAITYNSPSISGETTNENSEGVLSEGEDILQVMIALALPLVAKAGHFLLPLDEVIQQAITYAQNKLRMLKVDLKFSSVFTATMSDDLIDFILNG